MNNNDLISSLPVDSNPITPSEQQIVGMLFKEQETAMNQLFSMSQEVLLLSVLYIAFSTEHIDSLIKKITPSTEKSPFILIGTKTLLFVSLFYVLSNLHLVKKK